MTTIERYILKLLLVPAMMLPLSLAAADETPQQQAERAAEQARIANANAQVALEAHAVPRSLPMQPVARLRRLRKPFAVPTRWG